METNDFTKETKLNGPIVFLGEDFLARVKNIGLDIDPMDSVRYLLTQLVEKVDDTIRTLDFPNLYPKDPLATITEISELLSVITYVTERLEVPLDDDYENNHELAS